MRARAPRVRRGPRRARCSPPDRAHASGDAGERLQAACRGVAGEDDDRVVGRPGDVDEAAVGRDRDRVGAADPAREIAPRGRTRPSCTRDAGVLDERAVGLARERGDRARRRGGDVDVQPVGRDGDRRGARERADGAAAGLGDRDETAGREVELPEQPGVSVHAERRHARGRGGDGVERRAVGAQRHGARVVEAAPRARIRASSAARRSRRCLRSARACRAARPPIADAPGASRQSESTRKQRRRRMLSGCHGTARARWPVQPAGARRSPASALS